MPRRRPDTPPKPIGRPRVRIVSAPEPGVEYEEITLQERHTLNDIPYGPGRIRVRRDVALVLLENESNFLAQRQRLFKPSAGIITANGRLIPVSPDYFDDPDAWRKMPVMRTDGRLA